MAIKYNNQTVDITVFFLEVLVRNALCMNRVGKAFKKLPFVVAKHTIFALVRSSPNFIAL